MTLPVTSRTEVPVEPFFDSNRDSNADELRRTPAKVGELDAQEKGDPKPSADATSLSGLRFLIPLTGRAG